jgi:integrase
VEVGDLDTVPGIKLPSPPEDRVRYLEPEEIERLLAACRASRNRTLWHVVALALNTGMRQDEILGLEWTRVNLSTGVIALRRTASASQKGRKPRSLPMNDAVYQILVALQPEPSLRVGRVFRPGRGGSQIWTAWNTALRRAGIADFRFHDLRHHAGSRLMPGRRVA